MRVVAPFAFFRAAVFAIAAAGGVCALVAGCGSSSSLPGTTKPAAFAESRFRPNYGGDLYAAFYWPATTIHYRILNAGTSTGIRPGTTIDADQTTAAQAQSIRDAFTKWQTALAGGDPIGVRQFVEVDPSDTTADIDVAAQSKAAFDGDDSLVKETVGSTDTYIVSVAEGTMGRAIIRILDNVDDRTFRYTALHETGHALGLLANGNSGHSRHVGDVMYAIQPAIIPVIELQPYDINTIRADYDRPAPTTN